MEPAPEQIERATWALLPFVEEWNLPLNPEDIDEIAYAVLKHHDSTDSSEDIMAATCLQLEQYRSAHEQMLEKMRHEQPET